MLTSLLFLLNSAFNSEQEVTFEMRSFYICTRNEILDLNKISKFGNLIKVENLDHDSFNDVFKDLHIKKISYEINVNEKLILKAQDSYQNNVFYIEIFRKRKLFNKFADTVEFYYSLDSRSIPLNAFTVKDFFDKDIYIVENNYDIMEKMKLALEYVRLSQEVLRAEDKINKVFNLIKKALMYDSVKELNLEKEFYYKQLEIKLEILFHLINKSTLVNDLDNIYHEEDFEKNFMIFSNRNLKKKIDYNRSIIKRIMSLLNELILSISVNHKLEQNEYFLKTLNSVKMMLKLTDAGFWQLLENIEGFSRSESEDSLMAILVLNFVDEYLNYRLTFDYGIQNANDPWNILNFSDCFFYYIKNLKYFLKTCKTTLKSAQFSLKLFLNGTVIKFYEKSVRLFWSEHEKLLINL